MFDAHCWLPCSAGERPSSVLRKFFLRIETLSAAGGAGQWVGDGRLSCRRVHAALQTCRPARRCATPSSRCGEQWLASTMSFWIAVAVTMWWPSTLSAIRRDEGPPRRRGCPSRRWRSGSPVAVPDTARRAPEPVPGCAARDAQPGPARPARAHQRRGESGGVFFFFFFFCSSLESYCSGWALRGPGPGEGGESSAGSPSGPSPPWTRSSSPVGAVAPGPGRRRGAALVRAAWPPAGRWPSSGAGTTAWRVASPLPWELGRGPAPGAGAGPRHRLGGDPRTGITRRPRQRGPLGGEEQGSCHGPAHSSSSPGRRSDPNAWSRGWARRWRCGRGAASPARAIRVEAKASTVPAEPFPGRSRARPFPGVLLPGRVHVDGPRPRDPLSLFRRPEPEH